MRVRIVAVVAVVVKIQRGHLYTSHKPRAPQCPLFSYDQVSHQTVQRMVALCGCV